jgi:hypothetical protein
MAVLPEYRYGKVSGLYPDLTVVSERAESPMVCCGYCSTHMACITAKTGLSSLMTKEAHAIRAKGGRPHNAGSKASELRAGALAALGVTLKSVAITDIPARLAKGFAVEVAIQYGKLPSWVRVQTNDFGHSVCLFGWDDANDRAGLYDPLWTQGARGAWVPWSEIKPALWENGNHNTTIVRFEPVAGDYVIYTDQVTSLKTGKVASGTSFYNDWKLVDKRGAMSSTATVEVMGYRGTALAIQVSTGQGWPDGVTRSTLVFVPKASVTGIVDASVPSGGGCTDEELLAAEQKGYDLALSAFPPRPS